jgi:hypothetical protein
MSSKKLEKLLYLVSDLFDLYVCNPFQHDEKCMGEEKDHKPDIIRHGTVIKSGYDALEKLVRKNSYEIKKAPAFETILQLDGCCCCTRL